MSEAKTTKKADASAKANRQSYVTAWPVKHDGKVIPAGTPADPKEVPDVLKDIPGFLIRAPIEEEVDLIESPDEPSTE